MLRFRGASCFICGSPAVVTNEVRSIPSSDGSHKVLDSIQTFNSAEKEQKAYHERQKIVVEHSVFVIKSLFQVPDLIFLETEEASLISRNGKLQVLGFWHSCSESVEQARTIYGDLLKAVHTFRKIQHQLVDMVKGGGRSFDDEGNSTLETWRQFICNYTYGNKTDAFLVEDCNGIVENLLKIIQINSPFSQPIVEAPVLKVDVDVNANEGDYADEDIQLNKLTHNDTKDSSEMDASNFMGSTMVRKDDENRNYTDNELELLEEDSEPYSSEEEKPLVSDRRASDSEDDMKVETDPLEISGEEESSMSSGIGKIVLTRTLRSRKTVEYVKPNDDTQMSSSDEDSNRDGSGEEYATATRSSVKSQALSSKKKMRRALNKTLKTKMSKSFKCTIDGCDKILKSEPQLNSHLSLFHKLKIYKCPEEGCEKSFKKADWLKVHIHRWHKNEPLFKCKSCEESFWTRVQLRKHEDKVHSEGKQFICDICGNKYSCDRNLWNHRKLYHGVTKSTSAEVISEVKAAYNSVIPRTKQYQCRVEGCGNMYRSLGALQGHVARGHRKKTDASGTTGSGKEFVCELCGKRFSSKSYLGVHLRTVHVEEPTAREGAPAPEEDNDPGGVCELCGKVFEKKFNLYIHRRVVHSTKFICEECGKGLHCRKKLKHHLYVKHKIGTEEDKLKEYKREPVCRCEVVGCRKPFWGKKAEENFKKHMQEEHGGDEGKKMQFRCEECGKEFGNKNKIREHRLIHLNKDTKPFKCGTCGKGFVNRGYLRYHERNTHKAPVLVERKKPAKKEGNKGRRSKKKD